MRISGNVKLLGPSIILFLLSLFLPAFTYQTSSHIDGLMALTMSLLPAIFGILGTIQGHTDFFGTISWFANPILFSSWIFLFRKSRNRALFTSVLAFVLSLLFLTTHTIPVPDNNNMENISVSYGYFMWLASILCACVVSYSLTSHKQ